MKTINILPFLPLLISAYNLSPDYAIIYSTPSTNNGSNQSHNSYFGYSVLLYYSKAANSSWIIVGAPRANYTSQSENQNEIPVEHGVTYRCSLRGYCEPMSVENPKDEMGFIEPQWNTKIEKARSWFGAAMSLDEFSRTLMVCAPRTIVNIYINGPLHYTNTLHGTCYKGDLITEPFRIVDKNFTTFDFRLQIWYNPMNGFSIHYPSSKIRKEGDEFHPVIGSPQHGLYGTVHMMGQKKRAELPIGDYLGHFGYALSSGYYFHEDQLMIAGAAPGWKFVGQIGIMDPRTEPVSIIAIIEGKEVGAYFGASLATGDINNDGLDDLIVGAPHWKNDNGQVHIFLGNKAGFFDADIIIEGSVDDGLFGYAVTSGDLDGDGFDDIIVGAPWEESGVIYVYNGDSKLSSDKEQEVSLLVASQRIAASSIRSDLLRFGFSFSKPVDVDSNGFLDIAVGAYASGHAVILLSRPVLISEMNVSTIPATLPRNAASFEVQLCVKHFEKNQLIQSNYSFTLVTDEDYRRVLKTTSEWRARDRPLEDDGCMNTTVRLLKDIRNFVDPINIAVTHQLKNGSNHKIWTWNSGHRENCTLCPIEYKGFPSKTVRTKLAFDIGCGSDDICQAFIFGQLEFSDIRNYTWLIGSRDFRLIASIGNLREPAYLTTLTFNIPDGISLRSLVPSCQEEKDQHALRVTCDVGNPLETNAEKNISLDFDTSRMHNASSDGTELKFRVDINTRSFNRGVKSLSLSLLLKANVSVALSGKAYENGYYFNYNDKPSNVTFQHTYQISRFGVTPISDVRLTVRVPYKLGNLEYLTMLHKPRVAVLGRLYECSVNGISVSKPQFSAEKKLVDTKIEDELELHPLNNSRMRRSYTENNYTKINTNSHDNTSIFNKAGNNSAVSDFYKMSDSSNADVIYLNCSTPNVTCGIIVCNISSLKTTQDVVKLQIQLIVDNSKLTDDSSDKERIVHFTTEARVDIPNPTKDFIVSGTGIIVPVTTNFHRAPSIKNEISIWIILGSVLLGLLALCLIAVALRKIGFFKRNEKDKLETLKNTEAIPLESEDIFN